MIVLELVCGAEIGVLAAKPAAAPFLYIYSCGVGWSRLF